VISVATPLFGVEPQFPVNRTSAMNEAPSSWYGTQVNRSILATTASVGVICAATQDAPADTVVVYEFYNARLGHFFRTATAAEALAIDAGAAGPGWTRTGDDFRAYLAGSAAGQDVCRFYNSGANSHFYTAVADECAALKAPLSGWNYEGIAFRAMLPAGDGLCAAGTVPVYRMYNNGFLVNDSNHRFTTSQGNVVQLQEQGWAYEGVALCAVP
jgi:serine protease